MITKCAEQHQSQVLVIGIGNEFRQDDAVGLSVARAVKARELLNTDVLELTGEGTALVEAWAEADNVILIDAVVSGAAPGTVHRIDIQTDPLPTEFFLHSTHAFSIAEAVELGRILNRLPPYLLFYGIEGQNFTTGLGLSEAVEEAVPKVVDYVVREIRAGYTLQSDVAPSLLS